MELFSAIDFNKLFIPQAPIIETIIRGTIIYLSLILILRHITKRQGMKVTDLLVIVLISDAAQNSMSATYTTIADGMILILTIILWDYALDYLSYHFSWVESFLHPPPVTLVKNGRVIKGNMRKELIRPDELLSQVRTGNRKY